MAQASGAEIVEIGPILVAGTRGRGSYQAIPEMITAVFHFIDTSSLVTKGPPFYICHEKPEEMKEADGTGTADIEIAIPIESPVPDKDIFRCYELPGGRFAKIAHKGPYEECESTYNRLFAWLASVGKKVTGPVRECYVNNPGEVGIENTITEIYAPVS